VFLLSAFVSSYHGTKTNQQAVPTLRFIVLGLLVLFSFSLAGCSYKTKNVLFKNKEYNAYYKAERKRTHAAIIKMNADSLKVPYQYRYAPDEIVLLRFVNFPDDLLEKIYKATGSLAATQNATQGGGNQAPGQSLTANNGFQFVVDLEGNISLPLFGRLQVTGKTILEVRKQVEEAYSSLLKDAQVDVSAPSMRAIVLGEGQQRVISLPEERTHLTEVLALAGGLLPSSRIKKVQIIRGEASNPEIIWVDLTILESVNSPELIIHHNDIIYIEPRGISLASREIGFVSGFFGIVNLILTIALLAR
jgi:protein involved in polysaccharide export with SLBB domain